LDSVQMTTRLDPVTEKIQKMQKMEMEEVASASEEDDEVTEESDDDDDEDDEVEFNFDVVAEQAMSAVARSGIASSANSRELRELGLDIGLGSEQLYLTGSGGSQSAFDTAAAPGVCSLDTQDFSYGAGPAAPEARTKSREVRGTKVRPVNDQKQRLKEIKVQKEEKLEKWFGMRKRVLTPELERELQVLKLRGTISKDRFYKANDSKALPQYFVRATEIGGGKCAAGLEANPDVHWNSGRTFLESVLRDQKSNEWTWKKHGEVGTRGLASYNSGHGKPGKNGRKGLNSTKRGGTWKKKRKN